MLMTLTIDLLTLPQQQALALGQFLMNFANQPAAAAEMRTANGADAPAVEDPLSNGHAEEPKPRRGGRKPAAAPEGVTAIKTEADATAADAAGDFVLFHEDGSKRASFTHPGMTRDGLLAILAVAPTSTALWKLQAANTPTVDRLPAELRTQVVAAFARKLRELQAAEAATQARPADAGSELDEIFGAAEPTAEEQHTYSRDEVITALQLFGQEKGGNALRELIATFNVQKFANLPETQYPAVMAAIGAAGP